MKFKHSGVTPIEIDMTPMIDVVFQLISFFMMISNFDQQEADERVTLPRDQLAKPPEVKREHSVTINFGFDRNLKGEVVDPTPYIFFGDERFMVDQCAIRLKQEAQFFRTIGADMEEVTVEIRADAGVQSGEVQKLIQLCQEQGIEFQRFALKATQQVD